MKNVHTELKGDKLLITVDVSKAAMEAAEASSSGKSKVVASTKGFTGIGPVKLSLNVIA
jgi:hypothetical protein